MITRRVLKVVWVSSEEVQNMSLALVQALFAPVQSTRLFLHFCTRGPNLLSHSPLTSLGQLGGSDSSPCPPESQP